MEVKSVVNEVKNEYPKMEQITKKHLKNSIPNKWLKIGLSSLVITIIMKNNVFANASSGFIASIAGGAPVYTPTYVKICKYICSSIQIIFVVVFILTGLNILITKIKSKKQNEPKKVKKWVTEIFIISIILFILSSIIKFIV